MYQHWYQYWYRWASYEIIIANVLFTVYMLLHYYYCFLTLTSHFLLTVYYSYLEQHNSWELKLKVYQCHFLLILLILSTKLNLSTDTNTDLYAVFSLITPIPWAYLSLKITKLFVWMMKHSREVLFLKLIFISDYYRYQYFPIMIPIPVSVHL